MIPYSTQSIDEADIKAVVDVLHRNNITQGELVGEFERTLAKYIGVKFAVVFNSATSALYSAYKILNIDGMECITTPISFCATSNMLLANDIKPVFCDINAIGNIDVDLIETHITENTKAIVSVDYGGNSVEVDKILELCKKYNLKFISDSSHSLGGEYKGIKIGNFATMSIFSFHALKPITTIEGGAIVTNNEEYYHKALLTRSHGIIKRKLWESELLEWGYNFRLSDVACALGLSQLSKLDSFIDKRNKIARIYDKHFSENEFCTTVKIPQYLKSTHHLYPLLLNDKLSLNKSEIFQNLIDCGIGVQVHYKPIYQFALYSGYAKLPKADRFYKAELSIPCHQKMSDDDVGFIIDKIFEIFRRYS